MGKKAKKSGSGRVSWKAEAERLYRECEKLSVLLFERDELLGERAEELLQEKAKVAELETKVSGLEISNKDLDDRNAILRRTLSSGRAKSRRLEGRNNSLVSEIDSRRRLAGALAVFHHAGTPVENCYEEFGIICQTIGVDIKKIDLRHVAEAYKAAGRRVHKLVFEDGVALTPSRVGHPAAGNPIGAALEEVENLIDMSRKEVMDRMRRETRDRG